MVAQHPETYIFGPWGGTSRSLHAVPRRRRAVAAGLLPSRVGMADECEGAGDVHCAEDRRADQRDVPQPAVCRERIPLRATPEHRRTGDCVVPRIPGVDSTNLGRPLSSGIPVQFLNIVQPGEMYGDRLNSVDLRLGKILRYGSTRTLVSLDVFNLFNSNTTEKYQLNLRDDVSQSVVDHGGAVLQDQRADRLLGTPEP